jgi:protein SCO1/2
MRPQNYKSALLLVALLAADGLPLRAGQSERTPPELVGVGITEHLGEKVDLGLEFMAEDGYQKPLSAYFSKGRPVVLNLVYYTCPMLCNLVLNGQTEALRQIPGMPGKDFEIVTVSIDPTETYAIARNKKAAYLESYGRETSGWHFLTDYQGNVQKLAKQIGFGYRFDEKAGQYAHAAAIFVLTPEGKISRYLYGTRYKPFDLRMAIAEASEGKTGISVDRVLFYCFHYDPVSRSYVPFARNAMRLGGVVTVAVFGFVLWALFRRERVARGRRPEAGGMVTAK